MALYSRPVKIKIFGLDADGTTHEIVSPRLIPHTLDFPVSPETGSFAFSIATNIQLADRDYTGAFNPGVEQYISNLTDIIDFTTNIRGAWVQVFINQADTTTNKEFVDGTTSQSDVDALLDPTTESWHMIWLGKIISANFQTGQMSGRIDCSAIDLAGWLNTKKFEAMPMMVGQGENVGLVYSTDIPNFNNLVNGKLVPNRFKDGSVTITDNSVDPPITRKVASIVLDDTIDPPITLKMSAMAPFDFIDSAYQSNLILWTKADIFTAIIDYLNSTNSDLWAQLNVEFTGLVDNTGYAGFEAITVNSQQSLWGIITTLFNRKKSTVIFPTYDVSPSTGKISITFNVQNLENAAVGAYLPNTDILNFTKDLYADFYATLQQSPKLNWYTPFMGKKIVVQTQPVSVITTLNLGKNCAPAWSVAQGSSATLTKCNLNSEYNHVYSSFIVLPQTNYVDPADLGILPNVSDGWDSANGTLALELDVENKMIKNVSNTETTSHYPSAQTASIKTNLDSAFGESTKHKLEVIDSKLFKITPGTLLATFDPKKRNIHAGIGFHFSVSRTQDGAFKEFKDNANASKYFFTAKIEGLPPLFITHYPADYATWKEYDTVIITLDKKIVVYDLAAIYAIEQNGIPKCILDSYGLSGPGPRFIWSSEVDEDRDETQRPPGRSLFYSLADLIQEMEAQVAFYSKVRIKVDMQANGIHLMQDLLGNYVSNLDVADNSVSFTGPNYSIASTFTSIQPNSIVSKISWNWDANQTTIYTDFANYG